MGEVATEKPGDFLYLNDRYSLLILEYCSFAETQPEPLKCRGRINHYQLTEGAEVSEGAEIKVVDVHLPA